ncbi:myelin-oligodendrocyte glycoprotein-like, partial [Stegastes partitus]|uniref:Myelin-oligodendrocyte glycoprotein-like n=1 Tax=Stegastes partitus TaxID=144197 RepID=A0A9Y4U2C1_9TELE
MSAWFWLMLCFLVRSSEGQKIIRAEPGQNVTLPCEAPNNKDNTIITVEWIRPGLDPEHVLFYRRGHLDPDNLDPSYKNRTDLQDRQMKDGDVSLVLTDVKMEDTGTYECQVLQEGTNSLMKDLICITFLEVRQP